MTGYAEAAAWLKEAAPSWQISRATTHLKAGERLHDPTLEWCEVDLTMPIAVTDSRYHYDSPVLHGEGHDMLSAVQRAIGGSK